MTKAMSIPKFHGPWTWQEIMQRRMGNGIGNIPALMFTRFTTLNKSGIICCGLSTVHLPMKRKSQVRKDFALNGDLTWEGNENPADCWATMSLHSMTPKPVGILKTLS